MGYFMFLQTPVLNLQHKMGGSPGLLLHFTGGYRPSGGNGQLRVKHRDSALLYCYIIAKGRGAGTGLIRRGRGQLHPINFFPYSVLKEKKRKK